jgi:hypothetical protein
LLAQSRNRTVRETIASRSDVPLGIQAALAQDDATEVRAAVAGNAHTARSVLDYLCSDKSHAVLVSMLANANVPLEIVERLTFHRRTEVRSLATGRLNDTSRPPRVEEPQVEDAKFPELRERGTVAGVTDAAEAADGADAPVSSAQPAHGFAVVDMSSRKLVPPSNRAWATSRTEPPARGAVTEPASPRLAPVRGFRFSEVS